MNMLYLDIEEILRNPNQPRKVFNDAKLDELAESIRDFGVLQPLTVRRKDDVYQLIAGERRLIAAKKAGLEKVPCILSDSTDKESAIISLIENIQREDLSFYEIALSYRALIDKFSITQLELAKRLSISQSALANKLRILKLDSSVLDSILTNNLSERHARALLKLDDVKLQKKALKKIIKNNYNVKQAEIYIQSLLAPSKPKMTVVKQSLRDIRVFTRTLKDLMASGEKAGLDVDFDISQSDDFYEYHIRVHRDR